jgi:hypothetical protein
MEDVQDLPVSTPIGIEAKVSAIVGLLTHCVEAKQFVEVVPCLWVLAHTKSSSTRGESSFFGAQLTLELYSTWGAYPA